MLVLGIAVAVSLIAVLLCETDTLPVGVLSGRGGSDEFVLTMLMELLTLCAIPLALRLFRFKAIAARLGYMAIILLLSLYFVLPTMARCEVEINDGTSTADDTQADAETEKQ